MDRDFLFGATADPQPPKPGASFESQRDGSKLVSADRAELLAAINAQPKPAHRRHKWRVVRQYNHLPEYDVCSHRIQWVADLCAMRRTIAHKHDIGAHFTVRGPGERVVGGRDSRA